MTFFDILKDWILSLCDALADLDLSFFGWDISFYRLVLIVFFGGAAFEIIFPSPSDLDEGSFWDDDE